MTRADYILIIIVACALPFLYTQLWFQGDTAGFVRIQTGNKEPTISTLFPERKIHVRGLLGDSVIEVGNGQTRFISSPCIGQVCVHTGWLKTAGEVAACLPNRISLQLLGKHPRFDAINF